MPGTTPTTPAQAPTYPSQFPSYPAQPSAGMPSGAYPQQGYGQVRAPYGQYPAYGAKKTNGLAVASLVCGIGGFLFFVPAILGIVFGFIARSQIRQSAGRQSGEGLAIAGIIVGFAWIVLFVIVLAVDASSNNTSGIIGLLGFPG
jgi:hypothetical protein